MAQAINGFFERIVRQPLPAECHGPTAVLVHRASARTAEEWDALASEPSRAMRRRRFRTANYVFVWARVSHACARYRSDSPASPDVDDATVSETLCIPTILVDRYYSQAYAMLRCAA